MSATRASVLVGGEEVTTGFAPVLNPARISEVVGEFALGGAGEIDLAARAAASAFPGWAALSPAERAAYLVKAADALEAEVPELAALLTREVGKVLHESYGDAGGAPRLLRYFAGLAEDIAAAEEPAELPWPGRAVTRHVPMGPVGVIAPWNTPVFLAFMSIGPALMAGNPVIVKPPEEAPLALSRAVAVLADALPSGVVGRVPGLGPDAGAALSEHPAVRRLMFTGSVATGSRVLASAAPTIKNVTLELGGNDPALVLHDAVIDETMLRELVAGVFGLSGQICYNVKRIYVHRSRLAEFTDGFTELVSRIRVGEGSDPRATIGPVTTRAQYHRVLALRDATAAAGAKVTVVGEQLDPFGWNEGYFILPSVVTDIAPDAPLVTEEQFGPIVPILPFDDEEEAVRLANSTDYGLAASVWSADTDRAWALARRLEAGTAFVNVHRVGASPMSVPFGGIKHSGIGRTHGLTSVLECMEQQAVVTYDDPSLLPGTDHWNTLLRAAEGADDHA
ncbi:aldehyde dehydrogenase family protein [Streptomyces capitiformicae]|uniref:Aldehyde dehydrogenase n=1 Tax=Streptomyces capitiformicae TaxID=2014920 RepID=A0A918ZEK2_9ACTN|nr:aldehyde dehydrogenase family protein [Streptomyces capitiformicae]GHE47044.1 aldehyde dehydrogenase [Streptomyces capitiformicae]